MGILTDVIIGGRDEAKAIMAAHGAHAHHWPCVQSKGVDNLMLAALWSVLDSEQTGEVLEGDDLIIAEDAGSAWLLLLPDGLTQRLAQIGEAQLGDIATRWVAHEELQRDRVRADDAKSLLRDLAELASRALTMEKPLLLWMSL